MRTRAVLVIILLFLAGIVAARKPTDYRATLRLGEHVSYLDLEDEAGNLIHEFSGEKRQPISIIGKWRCGWGTKDDPSSHIHFEYLEFSRDGSVSYWTEDHKLQVGVTSGTGEAQYRIEKLDQIPGKYRETGSGSFVLEMSKTLSNVK